ncbi:hypothetical protein HDU76_006119 [Blyttiomyces sp. JEL0837]|nr:hypothetical protein HDU76_006119 [Blyttiomyces sp. JEL0837]
MIPPLPAPSIQPVNVSIDHDDLVNMSLLDALDILVAPDSMMTMSNAVVNNDSIDILDSITDWDNSRSGSPASEPASMRSRTESTEGSPYLSNDFQTRSPSPSANRVLISTSNMNDHTGISTGSISSSDDFGFNASGSSTSSIERIPSIIPTNTKKLARRSIRKSAPRKPPPPPAFVDISSSPFGCDECPQRFKHKHDLKRHRLLIHS